MSYLIISPRYQSKVRMCTGYCALSITLRLDLIVLLGELKNPHIFIKIIYNDHDHRGLLETSFVQVPAQTHEKNVLMLINMSRIVSTVHC